MLIADSPAWAEGMAASIRAGVTTIRQFSRALDGVLLALCDQPAFSTDTVTQLIAAQRAGQTSVSNSLDNMLACESQQIVQKALDDLNDLDRQVLMLKYSEGWSYREMAKHLGVREDTIEYRLLKARKNLRRLLSPLNEEEE